MRPGHDLTLDELVAFGRDGLAGYKVPRRLLVVDEVSRGTNGTPDDAAAKALADVKEAPAVTERNAP